jgi:hypothetical protein
LHLGLLLFGGETGGLLGTLSLVLSLEFIDASGGIDQLLLTGEKRVAAGANFDADVVFIGGSCTERMSARADYVHLIVCGVDSSFHGLTSGDFLGKLHLTIAVQAPNQAAARAK